MYASSITGKFRLSLIRPQVMGGCTPSGYFPNTNNIKR